MAPGVAKSFCKEFKKVLDIRYPENDIEDTECTSDGKLTNLGVYKALKEYRNKNRLIMNDVGYDYIYSLMETEYATPLDTYVTDKLIKQVEKLVEDDTHQAMEAVVHNLNSMHSRAGAQVVL